MVYFTLCNYFTIVKYNVKSHKGNHSPGLKLKGSIPR
jgi:hypothetical protein